MWQQQIQKYSNFCFFSGTQVFHWHRNLKKEDALSCQFSATHTNQHFMEFCSKQNCKFSFNFHKIAASDCTDVVANETVESGEIWWISVASVRQFRMTAGSAMLAAIPLGREWESTTLVQCTGVKEFAQYIFLQLAGKHRMQQTRWSLRPKFR